VAHLEPSICMSNKKWLTKRGHLTTAIGFYKNTLYIPSDETLHNWEEVSMSHAETDYLEKN